MTAVQPWLIQRAQTLSPLADPAQATLSKSLQLDYMGSAEFEFGALPSSLRAFRANWDNCKQRLVKGITEVDSPLRVFSFLSDEDFPEYEGYLNLLRKDKIRLKEVSGFSPDYYLNEKTNFWWDLDNNVMFSFKKDYMKKLPQYLQNSFAVMAK